MTEDTKVALIVAIALGFVPLALMGNPIFGVFLAALMFGFIKLMSL